MNKMYNEEIKEKFLNTYDNEETRNTIKYVFFNSESTERLLGKDLYDFNINEVEKVIKNASPQSYNAARSQGMFISQYIKWAIDDMDLRRDNMNPMLNADHEFYKNLIDHTLKIHYSDEELEDLLEDLFNAQDQAMIQLWFEGVSGKNFSELKNLSYGDVNWNTNELSLKDDEGNRRILIVSDRCMRYLERAKDQRTYIKIVKEDRVSELPLAESDLIFRNVVWKITKDAGLSTGVIYTRLLNIRENFDLETLNQKSISQSGQIYEAYKIYQRDGHFGDKKQWYEIGEKFNVSKIKTDEYEYPNITLMKDYITSENLKELYDIDVEIQRGKKN